MDRFKGRFRQLLVLYRCDAKRLKLVYQKSLSFFSVHLTRDIYCLVWMLVLLEDRSGFKNWPATFIVLLQTGTNHTETWMKSKYWNFDSKRIYCLDIAEWHFYQKRKSLGKSHKFSHNLSLLLFEHMKRMRKISKMNWRHILLLNK